MWSSFKDFRPFHRLNKKFQDDFDFETVDQALDQEDYSEFQGEIDNRVIPRQRDSENQEDNLIGKQNFRRKSYDQVDYSLFF